MPEHAIRSDFIDKNNEYRGSTVCWIHKNAFTIVKYDIERIEDYLGFELGLCDFHFFEKLRNCARIYSFFLFVRKKITHTHKKQRCFIWEFIRCCNMHCFIFYRKFFDLGNFSDITFNYFAVLLFWCICRKRIKTKSYIYCLLWVEYFFFFGKSKKKIKKVKKKTHKNLKNTTEIY